MLTNRGQREVGGGLQDALQRLRRRRAAIEAQIGALEVERADLGKIEAALVPGIELARRPWNPVTETK